ncbi:hypothetical protein FZEAL_6411 [Fusarium zealandicum]|uniref:CFEM domain-containing protein n=1 Tax=Fusarium zealandicum TaxID=1053134 RepID=A0A8H4XIW7_9HYPO|nr:hypothetical protein FZEAL_6411 [Fusarium zealandicum]
MAHSNADNLVKKIPKCVSHCFKFGVAATGCSDDDFDCWCYEKNHQIVVDTMAECLDNQERRLEKSCSDDEMFQMENSYWKICEQYWEPYGTATEPALSTTTTASKTTLTSSLRVSSQPTSSTTSVEPTTTSSLSEQPQSTSESDTSQESESASLEGNGMSPGAQAGMGIGITLGVVLIAIAVFLWLRERKRRYNLEKQLREAEDVNSSRQDIFFRQRGEFYEMEGDRPRCGELRGDMTPELKASSVVNLGTMGKVPQVTLGEVKDEIDSSNENPQRPPLPVSRPTSVSSKESTCISSSPAVSNSNSNSNSNSTSPSTQQANKMDNVEEAIQKLATRLRTKNPSVAVALERYISETDHLKDTVQAIVEDIGYCMKELDLRESQSEGLRRCTDDLNRTVDEHTRVTDGNHERLFRPRFNCKIKSLERIEPKKDQGDGKDSGSKDKRAMMELVVQFPAAEYNESPHSLIPGKNGIYIMLKDV